MLRMHVYVEVASYALTSICRQRQRAHRNRRAPALHLFAPAVGLSLQARMHWGKNNVIYATLQSQGMGQCQPTAGMMGI
jgi:hypothetical protein